MHCKAFAYSDSKNLQKIHNARQSLARVGMGKARGVTMRGGNGGAALRLFGYVWLSVLL